MIADQLAVKQTPCAKGDSLAATVEPVVCRGTARWGASGAFTRYSLRLLRLLITLTLISNLANAVVPDTSLEDPYFSFDRQVVTIPMRDGVRLYTEIYTPKHRSNALPILLRRTPYGGAIKVPEPNRPSLFATAWRELVKDGYIFVSQDVRGRYRSEGRFCMLCPLANRSDALGVDENTDAADTINWLIANVRGNNGRVAAIGSSYLAWLAIMAAVRPEPALRAVVADSSPADMFLLDDFAHNGAVRASYLLEYSELVDTSRENRHFEFPVLDLYDLFRRPESMDDLARSMLGQAHTSWSDMSAHPVYDNFWRSRSLLIAANRVNIPTLTVGGWFDQEDGNGPLALYEQWRRSDSNHWNFLAVGPWHHGGSEEDGRYLGRIDLGSPTGSTFRQNVLIPFLDYFLKDRGPRPRQVTLYEAGLGEWRSFDDWPTGGRHSALYLRAGGRLSFTRPEKEQVATRDRYVSDPASPVPYRARPVEPSLGTLNGVQSHWEDWLAADQRFVDGRPDVLTWTSAPLGADLVISGDVRAILYASTSASDTDWIVKLIDAYPDRDADTLSMSGYELMVTAEIFPARFRLGFEEAQPVQSGAVLEYRLDLHPRLYRFRKNHRLMVQIQSSWFPLYVQNPQNFNPNTLAARKGSARPAVQEVYTSSAHPSHIEMTITEHGALP